MQPDLEQHLRHLELSLLDPTVRADSNKLTELLADDFREFGSSGLVFDKSSIIDLLATENAASTAPISTIADFKSLQISAETCLLTYRAIKAPQAAPSLRSSIWVYRDDRWQMLFHQGTRIP